MAGKYDAVQARWNGKGFIMKLKYMKLIKKYEEKSI